MRPLAELYSSYASWLNNPSVRSTQIKKILAHREVQTHDSMTPYSKQPNQKKNIIPTTVELPAKSSPLTTKDHLVLKSYILQDTKIHSGNQCCT